MEVAVASLLEGQAVHLALLVFAVLLEEQVDERQGLHCVAVR